MMSITDGHVRVFPRGKILSVAKAALEHGGFVWDAGLKCWQALRNPRTIELAREIVSGMSDPRAGDVGGEG